MVYVPRKMSVSHSQDTPRGKYLAALSLAALGVVYGDIATSPLYTLKESFHPAHNVAPVADNILGVLSLILWSLTLIVSVKYLAYVLRADNRGEGGILALTALVSPMGTPTTRTQWVLVTLGLFGTALLYGDGIITPAITVLGAIEGLNVATPVFEPYIIPIACAIIVGLFSIQYKGTGKVGRIFGPLIVVWLITLAVLGVSQIVREPRVLAAADPRFAIRFFQHNGWHGFVVLGSVFLAITGAEALYADMGHFGRRPIRITWFALVLPALLLNYFGQGALLIREPDAVKNPFYRMAPEWALYPLVAIATFAAVIASQALISGVFSLTRQAVQLGFSPRVDVEHTSAREIGQIYIPGINWLLMLACIGLVLGFRSSSALAAAYGLAVTATMVVTTLLFYVVARNAWGWSLPKAFFVCGFFLTMELAFFGANVLKIPHGGWFPLVVGAIVYVLMSTWKKGRRILGKRLRVASPPLERFWDDLQELAPVRTPGTAVFMSGNPGVAPVAMGQVLRHMHTLHERVVLLHIVTLDVPHSDRNECARVERLRHGFYRVVLHYGFMEDPDVPEALNGLAPQFTINLEETTFFLGREQVLATPRRGMALWREKLFAVMSKNARTATAYFQLPADRVIEVGIQVEI